MWAKPRRVESAEQGVADVWGVCFSFVFSHEVCCLKVVFCDVACQQSHVLYSEILV